MQQYLPAVSRAVLFLCNSAHVLIITQKNIWEAKLLCKQNSLQQYTNSGNVSAEEQLMPVVSKTVTKLPFYSLVYHMKTTTADISNHVCRLFATMVSETMVHIKISQNHTSNSVTTIFITMTQGTAIVGCVAGGIMGVDRKGEKTRAVT